jgi:hypothetical protein
MVRTDGTGGTKLETDVAQYTQAGDWLYFVGMGGETNNRLYKMGMDGTGYALICPLFDDADYEYFETNLIGVEGDFVYFSVDDYTGTSTHTNNLYRVGTDGTGYTKLSGENMQNITFEGDWVYYENAGDNNALYKMHPDGTNETKLDSDSCDNFSIAGDWVYYCNGSDNKYLYKIRTDGTQKTRLNSDISDYINLEGIAGG